LAKKCCLLKKISVFFKYFLISRLRLNSLLATYGITSDKKQSRQQNHRPKHPENYPPLRERRERERPRSIKLKPQECFLFFIAFVAIAGLITYNVFMSYYDYYESINDDDYD